MLARPVLASVIGPPSNQRRSFYRLRLERRRCTFAGTAARGPSEFWAARGKISLFPIAVRWSVIAFLAPAGIRARIAPKIC